MKASIQNALFPNPHLEFFDKNGEYQGESINLMPLELLIGRVWGWMVFVWVMLMPFIGPLQYILVAYLCKRFDPYMTKHYKKAWDKQKKKILNWYTGLFWGWIIYLSIGILVHFA